MSRIAALLVMLVSVPAMAQITVRNGVSGQQVDQFLQQMQGALSGSTASGITPEQQLKLQQGLAVAQLYSCTEQLVGKQRLDAFVNDIKAAGKQVEALCKQARATEARSLALATLQAKGNDPVAIATRNCYYDNKPQIEPLLSSQDPKDIANYERWLEDPSLAEQEVREGDICKGIPNVQAAPASPITTQNVQDIQ